MNITKKLLLNPKTHKRGTSKTIRIKNNVKPTLIAQGKDLSKELTKLRKRMTTKKVLNPKTNAKIIPQGKTLRNKLTKLRKKMTSEKKAKSRSTPKPHSILLNHSTMNTIPEIEKRSPEDLHIPNISPILEKSKNKTLSPAQIQHLVSKINNQASVSKNKTIDISDLKRILEDLKITMFHLIPIQ